MTEIPETQIDDTAREILKKIDEAWPDPIVLRKDIAKFSCGLVTTKAMGTMDADGRGIPYSRINGKVAYEKQNVIRWLATKIKKHEPSKETRVVPRRGKNDILLQK
jgi:hypothetical protein